MVARYKARAWFVPGWLCCGASVVLACGSSSKDDASSNSSSGAGGDTSVTAGAGGAGHRGGTDAGGGGTAGSSSGSSGDTSAGSGAGGTSSAGAAGQGAAGSGGTGLTVVGDGELDETCLQRTSLHTSGSRIVELSAVTAEGDRAFLSFYDTEKQEECLPARDAEGTLRCLPPARDKDTDNVYYLDDQCTQEAHYRGICALDYQAIPVSSDPCDDRRRLVPFGPRIPDQLVYRRTPEGACEAYNELNNLHAEAPELVPSEYVELEPVAFRGKGRIWTRGFRGDGELRIVSGLLDSELDQPCGFSRMDDGEEHCAPASRGELGFTDTTCEQRLMTAPSSCGSPPPTYAGYSSGDQCNPSTSFVRATEPYEGELHLYGSCALATNMDATTYATEPVPASAFVTFESTVLSSDEGRLKPIYRTATDGGCFFQDFWDDEMQTVCTFTSASGGFYCLPKTSAPGEPIELFTDPTCETEAYYVKVRDCDAAQPPPFWVEYASACGSGFALRALDPKPRTVRRVDPAAVTLPALYTGSTANCVPYEPDGAATYFAAGDVVPNSEFMSATVEP